jgi:hypothetical protein
MFTESDVKEKACKMKGGTEGQLKMVEGAQKRGKPKGLKPENRARRRVSLPMASTSANSSAACAGSGEAFEDD